MRTPTDRAIDGQCEALAHLQNCERALRVAYREERAAVAEMQRVNQQLEGKEQTG